MTPSIESVFVGGPKTLRDQRGEWTSSIARSRVNGAVKLSVEGFEADKPTQPYHGGPDAACCVHPVDHYDFWLQNYGMKLEHGYLGENLVLAGQKESEVHVGDIVRIGSALTQVSGPRVPCANQARRAGRSDWIRLTIRENRTGFYLRVLQPGAIAEGDAWLIEERLNEHGSIPALNRCFYLEFDPALASEFAEMKGLTPWWRQQLHEKLARAPAHWSEAISRAE